MNIGHVININPDNSRGVWPGWLYQGRFSKPVPLFRRKGNVDGEIVLEKCNIYIGVMFSAMFFS